MSAAVLDAAPPSPLDRASGWLLPASMRRDLVAASRVRPALYWADLLLSAGVGWALFVAACFLTPLQLSWWPLAGGCALAFLRAAYFIHELAHRSERELPGFRAAWTVLVGVPILVPSLMMAPHRDHHRTATYGTARDPEYAPVPRWGRWRLLGALALYAWVPWLLAIRWTITATFSHLHPKARAHAIGRFSTADLHHEYVRPTPEGAEARTFLREELLCAAFAWTALGLTIAGILPWWVHLHRWAIMGAALIVNHARLLVIHRYEGGPFDGAGQTLDTVTLGPDSPLTEIGAPLGSRFHALHHELPGVPYHDLGRLHRRLVAALPSDHPYRRTEVPGFVAAWRQRWAEARRAGAVEASAVSRSA